MNLPSLREHGAAVAAALNEELAGRFGSGEAPDDVGWVATPGSSDFRGYGIVYALDLTLDGSIDDGAHDDADFVVQVTVVGATSDQAALVFDITKDRLLARNLTIPGRHVNTVELYDAAGGIRRDDTTEPGLFIGTPRFHISTTPA